jgi:hypothetical protein
MFDVDSVRHINGDPSPLALRVRSPERPAIYVFLSIRERIEVRAFARFVPHRLPARRDASR